MAAAGTKWIDCTNSKKVLGFDQLFKDLLVDNGSGEPAIRTYGGAAGGGDASAANQVLQITALNTIISDLNKAILNSSDSILDKRFPTSAPLLSVKQSIVDAPGKLMGFNFINQNTVAVYIRFYNSLVAGVTVGTTIPVLTLVIPPGDGTTPGFIYQESNAIQHLFSTGIVVSASTDISDTGVAIPATGIIGNVKYK